MTCQFCNRKRFIYLQIKSIQSATYVTISSVNCRSGSRKIILQNVDLAQKLPKLSAAKRGPRTHFCFYSPNFIVNRSIYDTINQQKYVLSYCFLFGQYRISRRSVNANGHAGRQMKCRTVGVNMMTLTTYSTKHL